MKKRSVGLTILGCFEIMIGVLGGGGAVLCWIILLGLIQAKMSSSSGLLDKKEFFYLIVAFFTALIPIITIITGVGILKLRKFSWKLNVFLYPAIYVYIYYTFFSLAKQMRTSIFARILENVSPVVWFSIPVLIIIYLTRPKVKEQFEWGECYLNGNPKFEHVKQDGKTIRREYDKEGQLIKEETLSGKG